MAQGQVGLGGPLKTHGLTGAAGLGPPLTLVLHLPSAAHHARLLFFGLSHHLGLAAADLVVHGHVHWRVHLRVVVVVVVGLGGLVHRWVTLAS